MFAQNLNWMTSEIDNYYLKQMIGSNENTAAVYVQIYFNGTHRTDEKIC